MGLALAPPAAAPPWPRPLPSRPCPSPPPPPPPKDKPSSHKGTMCRLPTDTGLATTALAAAIFFNRSLSNAIKFFTCSITVSFASSRNDSTQHPARVGPDQPTEEDQA